MRRIKLAVGEQHVLRLSPIASAGYVWDYVVEGKPGIIDITVATAGTPSITGPDGSPPPGFSFETQFTIKGTNPGRAKVRFRLHRPWEHDESPSDERVLEVSVY